MKEKDDEAQRDTDRFEKHTTMAAEKEKEVKRKAEEGLVSATAREEAEIEAARDRVETNQASMTQEVKVAVVGHRRCRSGNPPNPNLVCLQNN